MSARAVDLVPLIVANLYDLAGRLRARGELVAGLAGRTQAEWQVLSVAASEPPLTVAQAARRLGITRQAVQRTVNNLVEAGELDLRDNPDHKRSPRIGLTRRGRDSLATLSAAASDEHAQLAGLLVKRDWQELDRILAALVASVPRAGSDEG
ncbi:MarR family winged helix-turn-helix transcriptional regulator [Nannocystaceae bacterium ST9]